MAGPIQSGVNQALGMIAAGAGAAKHKAEKKAVENINAADIEQADLSNYVGEQMSSSDPTLQREAMRFRKESEQLAERLKELKASGKIDNFIKAKKIGKEGAAIAKDARTSRKAFVDWLQNNKPEEVQ